jgi:hypothetical protein
VPNNACHTGSSDFLGMKFWVISSPRTREGIIGESSTIGIKNMNPRIVKGIPITVIATIIKAIGMLISKANPVKKDFKRELFSTWRAFANGVLKVFTNKREISVEMNTWPRFGFHGVFLLFISGWEVFTGPNLVIWPETFVESILLLLLYASEPLNEASGDRFILSLSKWVFLPT